MERNKKAIVGILLASLLSLSVVPYFNVQAQSCDPNALTPVAYGQSGNAVRNAQLCLMEAGYNIPAGATGYYGSQTRTAVKNFYADWYGAWSGNSLGPKGVAELKSRLAGTPQTQPQQGGVSQQQLQQVLNLLSQGKTAEALALLLTLLGGQQSSTTTQQQQQQPSAGEEGFLTVEKDPSVGIPTLYEGQTARVAGIRFRADNGAVTVKSLFLRWGTSLPAPYRVISNLALKDSSGNVLYQTNVGASTFLQDSSLNYYLPVSGLNVQVPKNGYTSVYVEVTAVGTYPSSGVSGNQVTFSLNANDVRGVDGAGVDRFGPTGTLNWSVTYQTALAGNAYFVVAKNSNSPTAQFVFGDQNTGNAYGVKALTFDVTAKNDNMRLTQVTGTVTGTATVTAVYLRQGNNVLDSQTPTTTGAFTFNVVPSNVVISQNQTVSYDVLVDFTAPASGVATFTVSVSGVTGQNSLGNPTTTSATVASDVMSAIRVGPEVQLVSMTTNYTAPSQSASSSYSVTLTFNVTPRGGTIYMGTTTAPTTTFVGLELEKDTGASATATPNGGVVVQLKQGNTDITNTQPKGSNSGANGWYQLPESTTPYTFVVTATQNGAPKPTGASNPTPGMYRWIVRYLSFKQQDNGSAPVLQVPGVSNTFVTTYTNVQ